MRAARSVFKEIVLHTKPAAACAVIMTERPDGAAENWTQSAGLMDSHALARFTAKVAELKRTEPQIDWTGVEPNTFNIRELRHWMREVIDWP